MVGRPRAVRAQHYPMITVLAWQRWRRGTMLVLTLVNLALVNALVWFAIVQGWL